MLRHDDTGTSAPETHYRGTGVWPAVVIALVLAAALVIFVAQNTHVVALDFLWFDFRTSPAVLVLATGLIAVVGAVVAGAWLRVRRRRHLQQREELERLRREPPVSAVRSTPTDTATATATRPTASADASTDHEEPARPQ
jgi:uncharacterized integral membrane protein